MKTWVYAGHFVLLPLAAWAWQVLDGDIRFTVLVLATAIVYGYVVPGVATTVYGWWRFTGANCGGIFWHHGLMWGANLSTLLLAPFVLAQGDPRGVLAWIVTMVVSAGLHGFVLWAHDLGLVKYQLVKIRNPPAREGRDPATVVAFYAPWCFPLIGAGYALAALIGRHVLQQTPGNDWWPFLWLLPLGVGLMWLPATVVWVWRHGGIKAPAEE